jgi:pimeloyl-ACP methyl ester carboxylesterase
VGVVHSPSRSLGQSAPVRLSHSSLRSSPSGGSTRRAGDGGSKRVVQEAPTDPFGATSPRGGGSWLSAFAFACALATAGPASAATPPETGHRISDTGVWIDCRGTRTSAPTVVLEAGAFGSSADWDRVETALARTSRVCAYDRLGLGGSPDRTTVPDADTIARDLAATLDSEGETGKVILVGHSNGALYIEAFATLFPARVAGLAYVDGVESEDLDSPVVMSALADEERLADVAVVGHRLGLARFVVGHFIDGFGLRGRAARRKWLALTSGRHVRASREEVRQIIPSLTQVRAQGPISPAVPVAVVVAEPDLRERGAKAWREVQVLPAKRACRGWMLDTVGATHLSLLGRDRAYVLAAVQWLLSEAATGPTDVCTPDRYKS